MSLWWTVLILTMMLLCYVELRWDRSWNGRILRYDRVLGLAVGWLREARLDMYVLNAGEVGADCEPKNAKLNTVTQISSTLPTSLTVAVVKDSILTTYLRCLYKISKAHIFFFPPLQYRLAGLQLHRKITYLATAMWRDRTNL